MALQEERDRARGLERVRRHLDHPRRVLLRDLIVFELKLLLDQVKGLVISQAALVAFIIDFIRPRGQSFSFFYKVLALGERLDQWLSLYGPSRHAAEDPEGLFGESKAGSPTLLGQLEGIVHRIVVGTAGEWQAPADNRVGEGGSRVRPPEPPSP
jgi:hypothetical protein